MSKSNYLVKKISIVYLITIIYIIYIYMYIHLHCLLILTFTASRVFVHRLKSSSSTSISIEKLNICKTKKKFIGDVMVVYRLYLEKTHKTRQIPRSDLTDVEGMMTITLTVPSELTEEHQHKISPGKGVTIKNFQILPKPNYGHGDCDRVLMVNQSSTIHNTPQVSKE